MKRRILTYLILFAVTASVFSTYPNRASAAMDAVIKMSASKSVYDIGEELTISYTITPSRPCLMEATIAVSGGLTLVNATVSLGQVAIPRMVNDNEGGPYAGTIRVRANTAGDHTIALTNVRLGYAENPNDKLVTQKSITIHVRTAAEKQAADAEAERIREEQARKAEEERKRQEAINASIAAQRSIEESIRKSKEEEEYREALIASSIAASIRESESEVERTRPSEIGEKTYARMEVPGIADRVFYFALEEENISLPDEFEPALLQVNSLDVFAAYTKNMDRQTYLVYGLFEGDDAPAYYYYNKKTGRFFPFELLNGTVPETEETESTDEESSGESDPTGYTDETADPGTADRLRDLEPWKLVSIVVFSVLLGASIAVLFMLVIGPNRTLNGNTPEKKRRHFEEDPEDDVTEQTFQSDEAE